MTIVYSHVVATGGKGLGNFMKLLFWWKGSIYKLVLPEMSVYVIMYFLISLVYRTTLGPLPDNDHKKIKFHALCPWPDTLALIIATTVHGHDERGRMMRRTMMRYINFTLNMVLAMISSQVRVRFPTIDHFVEAGFLVPHEKLIIDHLQEQMQGPKYFVGIVWAGAVASKAWREGRITSDIALYHILKELAKFRTMCGDLLAYDWVMVPLVYTQVVTLATYIYFASCLIGKQFVTVTNPKNDDRDFYVPVFHFMEFFFMMGWLKVAETMINPWGADDDDFEANWLVDRNIALSYLVVDEMNTEFPEMVKDQYWDDVVPDDIPYTQAAMKYKKATFEGSAGLQEDVTKQTQDETAVKFVEIDKAESIAAAPSLAFSTITQKKRASIPIPFSAVQVDPKNPKSNDEGPSEAPGATIASGVTKKTAKYDPSIAESVGVSHLYERTYKPRKKDSEEELNPN